MSQCHRPTIPILMQLFEPLGKYQLLTKNNSFHTTPRGGKRVDSDRERFWQTFGSLSESLQYFEFWICSWFRHVFKSDSHNHNNSDYELLLIPLFGSFHSLVQPKRYSHAIESRNCVCGWLATSCNISNLHIYKARYLTATIINVPSSYVCISFMGCFYHFLIKYYGATHKKSVRRYSTIDYDQYLV